MKKVHITWNKEFFYVREESEYYSEEDVTIHDNGWVTIQQDEYLTIHYPPQRINMITVYEEAKP